MASRKMTFTLPVDLAAEFTRRVRPHDRSSYLAQALARQFAERDRQLAQACDLANQDPDLIAIEQDFDALPSDIQELWHDAPPR